MEHLPFYIHILFPKKKLITLFITVATTVTMDLNVGSIFEDIPSAKAAIKAYLADAAGSRFCIICKQNNSCHFRIRAIRSKKKGIPIAHIEVEVEVEEEDQGTAIDLDNSSFSGVIVRPRISSEMHLMVRVENHTEPQTRSI
jgi:hypothetical protein